MSSGKSIGPVRAWALAAGGMVGGGIYISLGVVIEAAGSWAWLSFAIAGLAALISAYSYGTLSNQFGRSGGAFEFLEEMDHLGIAGSLSWLLIIGYTLTISVYAYAFGHYIAHSFGGNEMIIRALALGVAILMIGLNLMGAGKLTGVEVVIVTGNLLILVVLAVMGILDWNPAALGDGVPAKPISAAFVGAAVIFISYEGFQLLSYEYNDLVEPKKYFVPVLVSASIFVVAICVAVTLGATMILGAGGVVDGKEVALSNAAERILGLPGLIGMTVAAAFATSAAINSTLFSTAKLAARIAKDKELPKFWGHKNGNDIPDRAVITLGVIAGILAITGSLSSLVEAASLVFVTTFGVVNYVCARTMAGRNLIAWSGTFLCVAIGIVLVYHLANSRLVPLMILAVLILVSIFLRPMVLNHRGDH